jgi:hypothetical protein
MRYIAHRGLWKEKSDQNTLESFQRAFDSGFGVELDVRDKDGRLVVSHDPISYRDSLDFEQIVELFKQYDDKLAINIKSDGLLSMLMSFLGEIDESRYFIFDMSVPETLTYLKSSLSTYMRISEYEDFSELHKKSNGIWLDAFENDWWIGKNQIFEDSKPICVVSPELHGREKTKAWNYLKDTNFRNELYICTDEPELAKIFFK